MAVVAARVHIAGMALGRLVQARVAAQRGKASGSALEVDPLEHLAAHALEIRKGAGLLTEEIVPGERQEKDVERHVVSSRDTQADLPVVGADELAGGLASLFLPRGDHRFHVAVRLRLHFRNEPRLVARLCHPVHVLLRRGGVLAPAPGRPFVGSRLRDGGK